MADKNIQIKNKNAQGEWDQLFPKTKTSIVTHSNGETLDAIISRVCSQLNNKVDASKMEAKIKEIVGSAPQALDTLQELATALNNDANFASTMTNILAGKVDKTPGKQLSTEDFTAALKQKLEKIKINSDGSAVVDKKKIPASDVVQDPTHRFIADTDRTYWNAKSKVSVGKTQDSSADIWFEEI